MASLQDRWWTTKKDPHTGKLVLDEKNRPIPEKTGRYGKGHRYRVRWIDSNGKPDEKSFPNGSYKEAKDFKTEIENSLRTRSYVSPSAGEMKIKEYGETYKKGRSQDERSKATLDSMFKCQIYPFLGEMSLNQVSKDGEAIRDWIAWMNDESGISVNYQYQAWNTLSAMLDSAIADQKIRQNPCKFPAISGPKPVSKLIIPWSEAKLEAIHEALPSEHQVVVPIGGGLGLRQGEILGFSPDDIDRKEMTYHCRRQVTYVNGKLKFKLPKGHKTRIIPLSHGTLEYIDYHCELYPSAKVTLPWGERDSLEYMTAELILPYHGDDAWRGTMFLDLIWRPTFEVAGVEYVLKEDGMHALRHLYASHMLASGVSIKELAIYLGHASEAFTLKKYAHLMPSSFSRARAAADTLFARSSS